MDIVQVIKESASIAWERKAWWLFGIFLAAGSGGSSGPGGGNSGGGGDDAPVWVIGVIAAIAAAAIGALLMNIVSEGALIEGVSRGKMTIREGMRLGWSHFGVVLRIKLLIFAVCAVSIALLAAPAWLLALGLIPGLTALLLAVPAVALAAVWMITVYLIYAFALRIAVLENRHAVDALHKARLFLHGRILTGLKLLGAMALGHVGVGVAGLLALLPAAAAGAALYFTAGLAPALIVGGVLALPVVIGMAGTLGAYRSSVWTLGYISEARG
jgi:hypothetical protein